MSDFDARASEVRLAAYRELAHAALSEWGLPSAASIELIVERENSVFSVDAGPRGRFALRIHRAGYHSDAELDSQIAWARALASDGVVHTASTIDTLSGAAFAVVQHDAVPEPRQVSLLAWEAGTQLADVGGGDSAMLGRLGSLMAALHDHAQRWTPPRGFSALRWDRAGLVGEDPQWGRFWEVDGLDADARDDLVAFRARAAAELDEFGTSEHRFGLIHGDFLPENVLIDGDRVTLLDFDDCGFGWFLFDIATALAMPTLRPEADELAAAFVDGYRSVRALPDAELAHLPLFLALRAATYAGWVHTRRTTEFARSLGPAITGVAVRTVRSYLAR